MYHRINPLQMPAPRSVVINLGDERRAKEGLPPLPLLDVREVRMKCMEGQAKMESDWNLAKQNIAKMQREDAAAFAEYQKRNHPPEEEVEINGSVIR